MKRTKIGAILVFFQLSVFTVILIKNLLLTISAKNYFNESDSEQEEVTSGSEYAPTDSEESISSNIHFSDDDNIHAEIQGDQPVTNTENDNLASNDSLNNQENDSSFEVRVNVCSVGKVWKNKNNEYLPVGKEKTKKYACMYCLKIKNENKNMPVKTLYSKLVEHLESKHQSEELVQKLLKLPKLRRTKGIDINENQKKRDKIISEIRNNGIHLHNLQVNHVNKFIVARRPRKEGIAVSTFGTCYKCLKVLKISCMHKHVSKCTQTNFSKRRVVRSHSKATIGDCHEKASDGTVTLISQMRDDEVLTAAKYDEVAIEWLNVEVFKFSTTPHRYVRTKADFRRLGRFLIELRKLNDNIHELADCFDEDYVDDVIRAARIMGQPYEKSAFLQTPATSSDMSHLIKAAASMYEINLSRKCKDAREQVQFFLKKFERLWHAKLGNTIAESQAQLKRLKGSVQLPDQEDLEKVRHYLQNKIIDAFESLKIQFSIKAYESLRDSIESYLHVSNCRRAGEVEKLSLLDFNNAEIYESYYRLEVRGKRTKPVPIVFSEDIHESLLFLIKLRPQANINESNPFVFSYVNDVDSEFRFCRACPLLKKFAEECGAKNPDLLRGTSIRKQVATHGAIVGLDDVHVEFLCSFLGHTRGIHYSNYRQSNIAKDILTAKMVSNAQTTSATIKNNASHSKQGTMNEEFNYGANLMSYDQNQSESVAEQFHTQVNNSFNLEPAEKNSSPCTTKDISTRAYGSPNDNCCLDDESKKSSKKKKWSNEDVKTLLDAFPNALDMKNKVPSAKDIRNFLKTTTNKNLAARREPEVRVWFHNQRKKDLDKKQAPENPHIPHFIYAAFKDYISQGKIPSHKTCSKFIGKSPSKSNVTIENIQKWIESAIKRRSM